MLDRLRETNGEDNLWTLSMVQTAMLSDKTMKVVEIADTFKPAGVIQESSPHLDRAMTAWGKCGCETSFSTCA